MKKSNGPIFKYYRKKKNITLNEIVNSNIIKISLRKLSEFENGKNNLLNREIKILYNFIGLEYKTEKKYIEEFESLFKDFYLETVFFRDYHKKWDEIKKIYNKIKYSYVLPLYKLAELIFYNYEYNDEYDYTSCINDLIKFNKCFHTEYKQILFDAIGCYYMNNYEMKSSYIYLKKAISINGSEASLNMSKYHMSVLALRQYDIYNASKYLLEISNYFNKTLNMQRIICISMIKAFIYQYLKQYDKSEKIYKKCIYYLSNDVSNMHNLFACYNDLLWNLLLAEKYSELVIEGNKAIKVFYNKSEFYLYISYAYYHLGKVEKAKEYINIGKYYIDETSKHIKLMTIAYSTFLSKNKSYEIKEKNFLKAYNDAIKYNNIEVQLFILDCLIELDILYCNKEKEYEHLKLINSLRKKNLS